MEEKLLEDLKETCKTAKGLRDTLFEELDKLRRGDITPKQAQMVARLAQNIIDSVRVEMEAYRHPLSLGFSQLPEYPSLEIE